MWGLLSPQNSQPLVSVQPAPRERFQKRLRLPERLASEPERDPPLVPPPGCTRGDGEPFALCPGPLSRRPACSCVQGQLETSIASVRETGPDPASLQVRELVPVPRGSTVPPTVPAHCLGTCGRDGTSWQEHTCHEG